MPKMSKEREGSCVRVPGPGWLESVTLGEFCAGCTVSCWHSKETYDSDGWEPKSTDKFMLRLEGLRCH